MATLSGNSIDAEVWAAYDDNVSYEEDGSRAKALVANPATTTSALRRPGTADGHPRIARSRDRGRSAVARRPPGKHRHWQRAGPLRFDGELPRITRRRRQSMAGSILEHFAELKSDYEIGKASRYKRAKTGMMTLGSHADYHCRTESAYCGAMEIAREMTRNNPPVMQGVRRLVANVVGRGFVLDSDSGDKGIDDVNGYRWAEWSRSPEACDDQQELDFHGLEKLRESRSRQGHGGACLRRAMFSTRKPTCPNASPLRSLPAWSDVPGSPMSAVRRTDILAVNLDLPLCVFLLDASQTNYSSFRGAID